MLMPVVGLFDELDVENVVNKKNKAFVQKTENKAFVDMVQRKIELV
jgi:hypothetical protein